MQFYDVSSRGSFIKHVVKILGIFDLLPPSWSLLLNNAYVIKWSFGWLTHPPPQLSMWFMDAPKGKVMK